MKTTLLGVLLLSTLTICAQTNYVQHIEEPARDTSKPKRMLRCEALPLNANEARRWHAVKRFNYDLLVVSDPSTLSIIGGDYHRNTSARELQKKSFILNANLQFPIALFGKRWYSKGLGIVHGFQIIPQVMIRILRDDTLNHYDSSMPVRTPSYMPRVTYFISGLNMWQTKNEDNKSNRYYFSLSAFHHSNGQDGPEFSSVGKYKNNVNTYNGNFGENVAFEIAMGNIWYTHQFTKHRIHRTDEDTCPTRLSNVYYASGIGDVPYITYGRIAFEYHPKALSNSDLWKSSYYGLNRVNMNFGFIVSPSDRDIKYKNDTAYYNDDYKMIEKFRIVLNSTFITDIKLQRGPFNNPHNAGILERLNFTATYYDRHWFRSAPNTALFLQVGYYGSDIYNIYFNESMLFCRFGLSVGVFNAGNSPI